MEDKFCVLDTNVIVYALNQHSPQHPFVHQCMDQLKEKGYRFCITEQILREVLVVVTQSRNLQKPLDPESAKDFGTKLLHKFVFLPSNNLSRVNLLDLIENHRLQGRCIHDANIVAVMTAHQVKNLFTFNTKDFLRFRKISLINIPH
ncbi:MAG: type II toxin-antitoxin system VapC family toxin [Deltaproteobacteria bacterium]|nr:type II toxin-antitoxin system VapC family toxin [Deltaproteobacteria bacterium]